MNLARTFVFVRHRVHVQPLADRTDHLDAMLVAAMAGSAFFAPAVTASRVATTVRPAVRMSSGEDPTANPLTQVAAARSATAAVALILALYPHQPELQPSLIPQS